MSTALTTDLLPSSVPKLESTGLNWTVFKLHFQDVLDAKGFWGHFDGTAFPPVVSSPATAAEAEALTLWNKNERTAKSLLTQKIPDSALILVHSHTRMKDRWDTIVAEYSGKRPKHHGCRSRTKKRSPGTESATTTTLNLFQVLQARTSSQELPHKDGCMHNDL
jgi:hypothetical protein